MNALAIVLTAVAVVAGLVGLLAVLLCIGAARAKSRRNNNHETGGPR
jgi:hypothetical protein